MFHFLERKNINPEQTAGCLTRFFFIWVMQVIYFFRQPATAFQKFYFYPVPQDKAANLGKLLEIRWERNHEMKNSLCSVALKMFRGRIWFYSILLGLHVLIFTLMTPVLFYIFLLSLELDPQRRLTVPDIIIMSSIIMLLIIGSFSYSHSKLNLFRIGVHMGVSIENLLFKKLLRIPNSNINIKKQNIFKPVFTQSKMGPTLFFFNFLWLAPLQALFIFIIVYYIGGFIPVIVFGSIGMPLTLIKAILLLAFQKLKPKRNYYTLQRMKYLTEFVRYFRDIKMYCCESIYEKYIQQYRKSELRIIFCMEMLYNFGRHFMQIYPFIMTMAIILLYEYYDTKYFFGRLFMKAICLYHRFRTVLNISDQLLRVSEVRSPRYFNEETAEYPVGYVNLRDVSIQHAGRIYTNINFEAQPGEFCVIVGLPKSGKTGLIKALIQECHIKTGAVHVIGIISYCPQERWIFDSTIRQNILFGQPLNRERYAEVLKISRIDDYLIKHHVEDCAKIKDIAMTDELTSKINFARAIYKKADIYIFDQPFRSLDSIEALTLLQEGLEIFLENATRIIATTHINYSINADKILAIKNDSSIIVGKFKDVIEEVVDENIRNNVPLSRTELRNEPIAPLNFDENDESSLAHFKSIYNRIQISFFRAYFFNIFGATPCINFTAILMITSQVFFSIGDYYFIMWAETVDICSSKMRTTISFKECLSNQYWIFSHYIYFMSARSACALISAVSFVITRIVYAKQVHKNAMIKLLEAKADFYIYDSDISLNFEHAMAILDYRMARHAIVTVPFMLNVFGSFIIVTIYCLWALIPVGLVFITLNILLYYYNCTATQLEYMQIATRKSLEDYKRSVFRGIETIRASKCEDTIIKEFEILQDDTTAAIIMSLSLSEFANVYGNGALMIYIGMLFVILTVWEIPEVVSIVVLAYAFERCYAYYLYLHDGVKNAALAIYDVAYTENLINYTNLETEGPFFSHPVDKPADTWPETGLITFHYVSVIYSRSRIDPVRSLNFTIYDNEKVALLGKVGSGKSTIIAILFNIFRRIGSVYIDGIHIDDVGLYELRPKISFIPKRPFIITTTLRKNIDLFDIASDYEICEVLDEVGIYYISLDEVICDDDYTYSEKQLICLARVLLNPNKIIVINESELKCSTRGDTIIRKIARNRFENHTVITVSNKLGNLMDMDRILIVEKGTIVEDDTPQNLIEYGSRYLQPFLNVYLSQQLQELKHGHNVDDTETLNLKMATSAIESAVKLAGLNK